MSDTNKNPSQLWRFLPTLPHVLSAIKLVHVNGSTRERAHKSWPAVHAELAAALQYFCRLLILKKISIFGLFCNTEAALKLFLVKSLKKAFHHVPGSKNFLFDQFLDYSLGSTHVSSLLMKTIFNKVIYISLVYINLYYMTNSSLLFREMCLWEMSPKIFRHPTCILLGLLYPS